MVIDVVRTYFDVASGFTELTRRRAVAAARTLLRDGQGEAAGDSEQHRARAGTGIQALAAELVETSATNRARLSEFIDQEVRRQIGQLDLVSRAEHERVLRRVAELERRLAARVSPAVSTRPAAPPAAEAAVETVEVEAVSRVAAQSDGAGSDGAGAGAADTSDTGDTESAQPVAAAESTTATTGTSQSKRGATTKSRSTKSKSGKAPAASGSTANRSRKNTGKRSGSDGGSATKGGGAGSDDASC